ncbi:MAG: hypothetical protein ACRDVG_05980 [Jatrophihabitantaceae bacterium]
MTAPRRLLAATAAVFGMLLATVGLASTASAAPYTNQATLSVSDQTPAVGATISVHGTGFGSSETVQLTLNSTPISLGSAMTDGSGNFSKSVKLPSGVTGTHTITAVGTSSGRTASVQITIGGGTGGGGSGGGGLASTGVAVFGIGGVGLALLVGGALLLAAGGRRKTTV